jgi:hypothetical protein
MINLLRDERVFRALSIVVTSTAAGLSVIVAAVVITVFVAYLPGGVEGAVEVAPGDSIEILSPDTGHNLDAVLGEDAGGAWAHAPGQDYGRALFAQPHGENPPSVLRWSAEQPLSERAVRLVHVVKGELLGAAEMLAEFSLVYWNRDLHFLVSSFFCFLARASPASTSTLLVAAPATLSSPAPTIVDRAGKGLVGSRYHRSLADHQHALLDQRPCNGQPGAGEDTCEGRPGNAHPFRGSFLIEPFEVGQAKGFEFVQSQRFDLESTNRAANGLEGPFPGPASDPPELLRSCHFAS